MLNDKKKVIKYLFIVFLFILAYIAYLLIAPFFGSIIIGLLVGYIFLPLNNKLKRFVKNRNLTALMLTLVIVAVFILLLSFLMNLILTESISFYNSVSIDKVAALMDKYFHSDKTEQLLPICQRNRIYLLELFSSTVQCLSLHPLL